MLKDDIRLLEDKIKACDENIKLFEEHINREQVTIKEYRGYISDPNSTFSEQSLQNGIDGCKKNIETFEQAIENEREAKKDFRFKIAKLEELDSIPDVIEIGVEIDKDGSND